MFRYISREYLAKQAGAEFVAHVSHELKTPLNTLSAYSELLLDYATLTDEIRTGAVNVIHGEVERMTGLINNLLNISKMEAGTLQLSRTRVKVYDLLQDAYTAMSSHALGKHIKLELQIPPDLGSIKLDKALFRIAIDNLLSNAIKYSNPGGIVTLSAHITGDNQMQISVRDQGIGISAEDQEKIFHKYYRASTAETASRSGHGLGLFLAKQIIDLHHGTITVRSELNKGTEFTITFRAQPAQLEESSA
jgi:two-component system sensor histidine kinase VicK